MVETMRAGVIGAGVFGGYHAQKWAAMPGARLAAVFDTHAERAEALAAKLGGTTFGDIDAFLQAVDVVSIASPAVSHGALALRALKAGKAVYVEKPLAVSLAEADAIMAEAAKRGLVVACGFGERIAVEATYLLKYLETPRLIEATRFGVASPRNQDVSVVLDLMIHDIDLTLLLADAPPLTVEAEGVAGASGLLDTARAEVTFTDGTVAILEASRVADAPRRTLRLTYESGVVEIDFLAGTLKNGSTLRLEPDFADAPGVVDRLAYGLERFLDAVRSGNPPVADAGDGARALDLALAVEQAAGG